MTEPIVKLTKKQKKAIKKQQKRQAEKRRLHALLIEHRKAAKIEAYQQMVEDAVHNQESVEHDLLVAKAITQEAAGALDSYTKANQNIRPLEVVHQQIIGD